MDSIEVTMIRSILISAFCYSCCLFADIGYTPTGANFGEEGVKSYALYRHGQDGALFLDPFLSNALTDVKGKKILDAGWSVADIRKKAA